MQHNLIACNNYEMHELMEKAAIQEMKEACRRNKVLRRLKKTLPQKIWLSIQYLLNDNSCLDLGVVSQEHVKGFKESGNSYFGWSTAVRHVYNDVSSCSYSDSYGGNLYIYLGERRYLRMHIYG